MQRYDKVKEKRSENLLLDPGLRQKFCLDGQDLTAFKENAKGCQGM